MHEAETKPDGGTVGLITAIIKSAVEDLHDRDPKHRDSAKVFFASVGFELLADAVGLDADAIRERIPDAIQ